MVNKKHVKKEEIQPKVQPEKDSNKKKSFEERIKERKELLRSTFLEIVKVHNANTKFDYNKYICGSGGKGLLCEAIGYNAYDKKLFQEVLKELKSENKIYHIGGTMYTFK